MSVAIPFRAGLPVEWEMHAEVDACPCDRNAQRSQERPGAPRGLMQK